MLSPQHTRVPETIYRIYRSTSYLREIFVDELATGLILIRCCFHTLSSARDAATVGLSSAIFDDLLCVLKAAVAIAAVRLNSRAGLNDCRFDLQRSLLNKHCCFALNGRRKKVMGVLGMSL